MGIQNSEYLQPDGPTSEPEAELSRSEQAEADQLRKEEELDEERMLHNERTGGAEVVPGAIREEREEHQRRTSGE